MALIFDNNYLIPEVDGKVLFNSQSIDIVTKDEVIVWRRWSGKASPLVISTNSNIVAGIHFPAGVNVTVCITGAGGSGGCTDDRTAGGGSAGEIKTEVLNLPFGTSIPVTLGVGGLGVYASYVGGNPGTGSSFGTYITTTGGIGGGLSSCGPGYSTSCSATYPGKGASRTTCGGVFVDGKYTGGNGTILGGQAGAFGNGGNSKQAGQGGGAGGGGGATSGGFGRSGAGFRGQVNIYW